jgi:hypothetical protein
MQLCATTKDIERPPYTLPLSHASGQQHCLAYLELEATN